MTDLKRTFFESLAREISSLKEENKSLMSEIHEMKHEIIENERDLQFLERLTIDLMSRNKDLKDKLEVTLNEVVILKTELKNQIFSNEFQTDLGSARW